MECGTYVWVTFVDITCYAASTSRALRAAFFVSPYTREASCQIVYFQFIQAFIVCVCVKREARERINCACEKYDRQRRHMTKEGKIQKIWEFLILVRTSRRRDDSMMDSNIFRRWVLLVNAYVHILNRTCGIAVGAQYVIFSTCICGVSLLDVVILRLEYFGNKFIMCSASMHFIEGDFEWVQHSSFFFPR